MSQVNSGKYRVTTTLWSYTILSGLFGSVALISFIIQLFDVGISMSLMPVVDIYRELVHPIFDFLFGWLWFDLPKWYYDWSSWSAICTAAYFRSGFIVQWQRSSSRQKTILILSSPLYLVSYLLIALTVIMGVMGVLYLLFLDKVMFFFERKSRLGRDTTKEDQYWDEQNRELATLTRISLATGVVGALMFFIVNGQMV